MESPCAILAVSVNLFPENETGVFHSVVVPNDIVTYESFRSCCECTKISPRCERCRLWLHENVSRDGYVLLIIRKFPSRGLFSFFRFNKLRA